MTRLNDYLAAIFALGFSAYHYRTTRDIRRTLRRIADALDAHDLERGQR